MDGRSLLLRVLVVGGWLLLAGASSLFDDVDMTLGAPRVTTAAPRSPGESLFGGTKMSLSTKELQEGLGGVRSTGGASALPTSGVYRLPKPQKKVASATVSTSLTGPGRGSLFDALPNAGASLPGAPTTANRYFTTQATPRQAQSAPRTSLFEVEGLLLPLSRSEAAAKTQSPAPQSVSVPRPQGPPRTAAKKQNSQESLEMMKKEEEEEEDEEEAAAISALRLLERFAPQLAAALNATVKRDNAATFPHPVQGDFQLALETLSASPLQDEDHTKLEDNDYSYEDDLDLFSLLNDENDQSKLLKDTRRLREGNNIASPRRRRLEDLRLALEIIQSLKRDRDADEEFELRLAKSIFDQHIKSLSELTRRQRDTIHSLVNIVRGSSTTFRNPNSFVLPPVKDARPPASRRNSYLLPQRDTTPPARRYDPPQREPAPPARFLPAPPGRSYSPPQRDETPPAPPPRSYSAPQRQPEPPASRYGPPQRDETPPAPPPRSYSAPQRQPELPPSRYGPPQRDETPPSPPSPSYGPPQLDALAPPPRTYGPPQQDPVPLDSIDDSEELRDFSPPQSLSLTITPADIYTVLSGIHSQAGTPAPQAPPVRSYGAPKKADPTGKPVYYIAVPSNLRPQADPPQADPQPPAPPPTAPPSPPPVVTTTRRPSVGYLPPRDDVRPLSPSYRAPSDTLPLESLESLEDDSWRPVLSPAAPGGYDYTQRPSDEPRDAVRNTTHSHVYNYHYHYHFGQDDSSASDEEAQSDDVGQTKERLDDDPRDDVNMGYGKGRVLSSPPSTSTSHRTNGRQSDASVSSYSSISASDDPLEQPSFQPPAPAPPSGGYGAPRADPPASPPPRDALPAMRYGPSPADAPSPLPPPMKYGSPPTDFPVPPPMRYGPPPTDIPPPPMRYGPPPAASPSRYAPPPAAPPGFYRMVQAPTRFPRSPTPITFAPANPMPPAPPPSTYRAPPADPRPPSTYGAPPADPRPPAPPPATYGAPPADPRPPAPPPATYGAPPADPRPPAPPPATYGAPPADSTQPPADPRPPAPPPRPPPLPKSHFSVFNKKAKAPKFFKRAPVVAVGPVRLGQGVAANPAGMMIRDPQRDDTTRSPLQREQEMLQLQLLRNEQRLRDEQRTLRDINELRYQILAQEQQRDDLRENLYKGLKREKDSGLKKMFYKGAMLLGAMSLVPFATGRRRREAPTLAACPSDAIHFNLTLHHAPNLTLPHASNLTLPHAPNCSQTRDADPLLGNVVGVLRARQSNLMQDVALTDLVPILPPSAALRHPGCLRRSFCRLMLSLEGTSLYKDFLDKYLQLFPEEGRGGYGVAGQALQLAHQRLADSTEHSKGTCRAYSCPYPDQDL